MTAMPTHGAGRLSDRPLWQDALAPAPRADLPARADVVVVGAGVTGLSAALSLARAGREVVVLDAGDPATGASTRNAGVLGFTLKAGFADIARRAGEDMAMRVFAEARQAFHAFTDMIAAEGIDCDLSLKGRLMCARTDDEMRGLAATLEDRRARFGDRWHPVSPAHMRGVLDTDAYRCGAVVEGHGTFDPGLFMQALIDRARAAGVTVAGGHRVAGVRGGQGAFDVTLDRGQLRTREVIFATNGYTDAALPFLRRRIVPVNGFMVATPRLDPALAAACLPGVACFHDLSADVEFGRLADRGRRIVFGGGTGALPSALPAVARRLARRMVEVFPQLALTGAERGWTGACGGTFTGLPHLGSHDGIHYAAGYGFGSGMPIGHWLGARLADRILGRETGASAFAEIPMEARAWYTGRNWLAPFLRLYVRSR
jgi:glycine/D-amino acid oxidase-like deaminating enzyme